VEQIITILKTELFIL